MKKYILGILILSGILSQTSCFLLKKGCNCPKVKTSSLKSDKLHV